MWTNKESFAVKDGLEGLTKKESKLASYWNTPFKKLCLGMAVNGEIKWMKLDNEASSLYGVIADEQFRATSARKATWLSMIAGSNLQENCNVEGFNVREPNSQIKSPHRFVRIGFVANNEDDCDTCDSWIGFGDYSIGCGSNTIRAFGYIFVQ